MEVSEIKQVVKFGSSTFIIVCYIGSTTSKLMVSMQHIGEGGEVTMSYEQFKNMSVVIDNAQTQIVD